MTRQSADATAAACVALAMTLIVGTALLGVPLHGRLAGHDADFAVAALAHLDQAWAAPGVPPAWLTEMQGGFGGPLFQFYPPLAFLLALGVEKLLAVDPAIAVTVALARLAALGTCFLWLRGIVSARNAWIGAAAYVVLPFTGLVDPIVRFPFSELVASGMLPLLPLAVGSRRDARVVLVGVTVALLALTNVPVAIAGGAACGLYALALGGWRRLAETALGGVLGAALAAWHFGPALLGMDGISVGAMLDEGHRWTGTVLFAELLSGSARHAGLGLFRAMLHGCLGVSLAGACAFLRLVPRPLAAGPGRASLAACLGALVLCTPLAAPAWQWFGLLLDWVQFPWRFLLPATLFGAALAAILAERRPGLRGRVALTVCAAGLAVPVAVLAVNGMAPGDAVQFQSGPARVERALAELRDPPEYVPAAARDAGWLPWLGAERLPPGVARDPTVERGEVRDLRLERHDGALRLQGQALGPAEITMPQFWYPGWRLLGSPGAVLEPGATGLVQVSVAPGRFDLRLARGALPGSAQGLAVSAAAALAAAMLLRRRWWPAHAAARDHAPSVEV